VEPTGSRGSTRPLGPCAHPRTVRPPLRHPIWPARRTSRRAWV
jgi:hypothetical protein